MKIKWLLKGRLKMTRLKGLLPCILVILLIVLSNVNSPLGQGGVDPMTQLTSKTETVTYLLEWNRTWGGGSGESGRGIAIDNNGSVYIAGVSGSFGDGPFLVKYNRTGAQLWNRTWTGSGWSNFIDVGLDAEGNVYLIGVEDLGEEHPFLVKLNESGYHLWNRTLQPGAPASALAVDNTSAVYVTGFIRGADDIAYVWKYNATGHFQWNFTWSGNFDFQGESVTVDPEGYIYFAGRKAFTVYNEAFIVKLHPNQTRIWNLTYGGIDAYQGYAIASDRFGNLYLSGHVTPASGNTDVFAVKFTSAGQQLWNTSWGGGSDEFCEYAHHLAVDSYNNSYVTGYTSSYGAGGINAFVVKFQANGSVAWYRTWGAAGTDTGCGIGLDGSDNLYLAGRYQENLTVDTDAFLTKWGPDTDGDGLTDDQETYLYGTNRSNADSDSDRIPDGAELALTLDPLNGSDAGADFDGDQLSNLGEYWNGTGLYDPDSDGDGLLDGAEVYTYQTHPLLPDTDGDTYSDGTEVAAGTDPLDPADYPSDPIPVFPIGMVVLLLAVVVGVRGRKLRGLFNHYPRIEMWV